MQTVQANAILAGAIYGARIEDIFAPTKTSKAASDARAYAMQLCFRDGMTKAEISRQFRRDPKSVHQAIRKGN
jgi:hypothetical protein